MADTLHGGHDSRQYQPLAIYLYSQQIIATYKKKRIELELIRDPVRTVSQVNADISLIREMAVDVLLCLLCHSVGEHKMALQVSVGAGHGVGCWSTTHG